MSLEEANALELTTTREPVTLPAIEPVLAAEQPDIAEEADQADE